MTQKRRTSLYIQKLWTRIRSENESLPTPEYPRDVRIGTYEDPFRRFALHVLGQALVDLTTPGRTWKKTAMKVIFSNEPEYVAWRLAWGFAAGYHPDAVQRRARERIRRRLGTEL